MSLSTSPVRATVAVADIDRAAEFYEGKLGLEPMEGGPDMVRIYPCGEGTQLQVYASPDNAGKATATVASWSVEDLEALVGELTGKGVEFASYDTPGTAENGIHTFGAHKVAWMLDPDGNNLAVDNGRSY